MTISSIYHKVGSSLFIYCLLCTYIQNCKIYEIDMIRHSKKPVEQNFLTILSWNIDGLDNEDVEIRALAVCDVINNELPDVCLMQEVTDDNLSIFQSICENYVFKIHRIYGYFNIIMIKEDENFVISKDLQWIHFPESTMGRFVLYQEVRFYDNVFTFITTHLESLKDNSTERKRQLKCCFEAIAGVESNVVFAGDLNIRENEIKALKGLPESVYDAWEESGKCTDTKYTWDLLLNDNKDMPFKPRARYDRMYFKASTNTNILCADFKLVGTSRIEACKRFPSDHFGILAKFALTTKIGA